MRRTFRQLDVFGSKPFSGNPLAVVVDSEDLTTEQMQTFTRWANLSECTFLFPPSTEEADYRVRIFTLAGELAFAGHPTLGSARAWLSAGGQPRRDGLIVQECRAGLIPIRLTGEELSFAAPPLLRSGPVDAAFLDQVISVLGVDAVHVVDSAWIDNGPGWVGVLLPSAAAVLDLEPDIARYDGEDNIDIGVIGPQPEGSDTAFELRAFFTTGDQVLREDPVTGSLNASAAQWLLSTGRAKAPYLASQGTRLGRSGRVSIDTDDKGTVWVGGRVTVDISGHVEI